jgi:hypothetical protein
MWIFGIIEENTGRFVVYPVYERTKDELWPIIERHCSPTGNASSRLMVGHPTELCVTTSP